MNDDPLDERLRAGFHELAAGETPPAPDPTELVESVVARRAAAGVRRMPRWLAFGAVGVIVAAGAATGVWAGSSPDTPARSTEAAVAGTTLWRCPGGGRVGRLFSGDRVVLTGRSTDQRWVELRNPTDLAARSWVSATAVRADDSIDGLPVVDCATSAVATPSTTQPTGDQATTTTSTPAGVTSSTAPGSSAVVAPTTTVPKSTPTTTTGGSSSSTTSPSTTAPADSTGPSLANVGASPSTVWTLEQPGVPCPADKKIQTTLISAYVTDSSGVASARVDWSVNGKSGTATMTATGSTWRATLGPFAADTLPTSGGGMNQSVSVTVRATDTRGNSATSSTSFQLRSSAECFG